MKKIIVITIILIMVFSTGSFAQPILPDTVNDLDFMKKNYYVGNNYTFKNISIGAKGTGKVMSVSGHSNPNTDVYTLIVLDSGLVTIEVMPLNKLYYCDLKIDGPLFVSNISGTKKYYTAGNQKNSIAINDFNGYGNYYKSVYLNKGIYYFSVSGKQYSKNNQATNYLEYVDYKITVKSTNYQKEPNIDTNQSSPYVFKSQKDRVKGCVSMDLMYANGKYLLDSKDRFLVPAGNKRDVLLKITNTQSNLLNVFKKKLEYKRNNDDKTNLEIRKLTNDYKSNAKISVSIARNGSFKLLPNEAKEIIFTADKDKEYYIDISASFPSEYDISYEEIRK